MQVFSPVLLSHATDLWSELEENQKFFDEMGLSHEQITPVKADTTDLPLESDF
jgi:hypothetical protein